MVLPWKKEKVRKRDNELIKKKAEVEKNVKEDVRSGIERGRTRDG